MQRRRAAPLVLLAAIAATPSAVRAQDADKSADERGRVERVAALGRLWSEVKFFHPYLAHRDIDWDGAFVAALPKVNAATTPDGYAAAVQGMLDALGDPATRVVRTTPPAGAAGSTGDRFPVGKLRDDGTFVVTVSDYEALVDFGGASARFERLVGEMEKATAAVFDLRTTAAPSADARGMLAYDLMSIDRRLSTTEISAPGQRTRMHVGFAPQQGATSGGYYSAETTAAGQRFAPSGSKKERPFAFIVNQFSELPPIALALQAAGKAAIVVEGAAGDASVVSTSLMHLPQDVVVVVRLSEVVYDDEFVGLRADAVVPAAVTRGDDDPAMASALALVRREKRPPPDRAPVVARVAPRVERAYAESSYPSTELRVLAAVRVWSTIHYFDPYLQLLGEDWDAVLPAFIPRMESARDATEYALAVAEMVTHIHDSHGFVRSKALADWFGAAWTPLRVRMIEGVPVVTGWFDEAAGKAAGVEIGDVVESIDGEAWKARYDRIAKHVAGSTPQALDAAVASRLLNGADGSTSKLVLRGVDGKTKEAAFVRTTSGMPRTGWTQRSGNVYRLIADGVGYADLDRLDGADVDAMFDAFKDTKAIVFDMRGYPHGTAWSIAPRLARRSAVVAARFQCPVLLGPESEGSAAGEERACNAFPQRIPVTDKPLYEGRTVMLIDGRTQSQAEHTGLFFEAANGTKFVGSPTAGANGDVTCFLLPGGIGVWFTGQAVTHADGRQLQRVGLQPDVEARPTIAGVRAGRDEVLEKALEYLAGPESKK